MVLDGDRIRLIGQIRLIGLIGYVYTQERIWGYCDGVHGDYFDSCCGDYVAKCFYEYYALDDPCWYYNNRCDYYCLVSYVFQGADEA